MYSLFTSGINGFASPAPRSTQLTILFALVLTIFSTSASAQTIGLTPVRSRTATEIPHAAPRVTYNLMSWALLGP